jgi:hypothetical protein
LFPYVRFLLFTAGSGKTWLAFGNITYCA